MDWTSRDQLASLFWPTTGTLIAPTSNRIVQRASYAESAVRDADGGKETSAGDPQPAQGQSQRHSSGVYQLAEIFNTFSSGTAIRKTQRYKQRESRSDLEPLHLN
jgi:hypothetical protein